MAISKAAALLLFLMSAAAGAREAATPASCQAAAAQPPIADVKAALDRNPSQLPARFKLADAWSDAGCFNEALQVLQGGRELHPESKELETRLRVARSLVREETYFENLDRASADAKLKRDMFRCTTLADTDACNEALLAKPEDPSLLVALGDALLRSKRPSDAVERYRRAAALAPEMPSIAQKISAAEAQLPPTRPVSTVANRGRPPDARTAGPEPVARLARTDTANVPVRSVVRYSNVEPATRSH